MTAQALLPEGLGDGCGNVWYVQREPGNSRAFTRIIAWDTGFQNATVRIHY